MSAPVPDLSPVERWRLLLGEAAQPALQAGLGDGAGGRSAQAMDQALAWLYGRDDALNPAEVLDRHGGDAASVLSVPDWINQIHTLFPKETIERLERDAIERYGIDEVVTNPEVLARATPNPALLEAVLRTKHLMNPAVLELARQLVAKVVAELIDKLAKELRHAFSGQRQRHDLARQGAANQFAARETLRRNLRHYDPQRQQLVVQQPLFYRHRRKHLERWQVLLVVDQSGSMLSSVIHAAVTAACLWGLPGIQTHLIAFDTAVVDLTADVQDPVQTLMQVQLGGGTDIAGAVDYAAGLIEAPKRAIVVVISDFYEGGHPYRLIQLVRGLVAQGTQVLGLAALDEQANPVYDRDLAAKLVEVGAHIGAMTPGQLANWLAEKLA